MSRPVLAATMRRYPRQVACSLRPRSVGGVDLALRCFVAFLLETAPDVVSAAEVNRRHIEDYKPWPAARPGRTDGRVTANTIAHRPGTLRMFFERIDERGWGRPLPTALDDPVAARFLRSAWAQPRQLTRVVCEVLSRTGLRVGEFVALTADAVVLIGAGHWLHVPVGKLHDDRYLPLHPHPHPQAHVRPDNPLLPPRENGRPLDRHTVTRLINKATASAGLGHVHPHQLRHTLATQAINRGMSLEAIAALLGHHSLDMTLRYAKIANRTVAEEYFAVTEKVEAPYGSHAPLPAEAAGPKMTRLRREHYRMLGNGYCAIPSQLDCAFESICETCTHFQPTIEFRPTLQRQRDDAAAKQQTGRQQLFDQLLTKIDHTEAS